MYRIGIAANKPHMRHWCNGSITAFLLNLYTIKLIMNEKLSTQFKGTITELQVAAHLLALGYNVS